MENKIQCPQCGAASSTKISDTEYHCVYCNSNFQVELSKAEMIASLLHKLEEPPKKSDFREQVEKLKAEALRSPEKMAEIRRRNRITVSIILGFFVVLGLVIFFSARSGKSGTTIAGTDGSWETPSVYRFQVFAGSKGPVIWIISEQSGYSLDSARFTLKIINPVNNTTLTEFPVVPDMSWHAGFDIDKTLGDFYACGDTCWVISENAGLTARDIYTGKIIIDEKQMKLVDPKLSAGVSKASYRYYDHNFEVTTNDGFEYIFSPGMKHVFTKDEWKQLGRTRSVVKTFFILTETKRPQLFCTKEKTSPVESSSSVFTNELENFTPGKRPDNISDNVLSIDHLLPDKTFFNGKIEYADSAETIVMYQDGIGQNAGVHVCSISSAGNQLWDTGGDALKNFRERFAETSGGIDFVYSPSGIILYSQYAGESAEAFDWKTGKLLWSHTAKKS
ncbi:MAG TPA: hypothetical protein VFU15_14740 [Bacteroidia bacterium]|nr:hypothetical protein [Bacteroidia bacterium]